jgi:tetratricopeptide (TPR) repeat protein
MHGAVLRTIGRGDEAEPHERRALELALETGDRVRESRARIGLAQTLRYAEPRQSQEEVVVALGVARGCGAVAEEGLALMTLGRWAVERGDREAALDHLTRAFELGERTGNRHLLAGGLNGLGVWHRRYGDPAVARANTEASLRMMRDLGDRRNECKIESQLGSLLADDGRLDEALAHFERVAAVARAIGDPQAEGLALAMMGELRRSLGRADDALHFFHEAVPLLRSGSVWVSLAQVLAQTAVLASEKGDEDAAQHALDEAEAIGRRLEVSEASGLGVALDEARAARATSRLGARAR